MHWCHMICHAAWLRQQLQNKLISQTFPAFLRSTARSMSSRHQLSDKFKGTDKNVWVEFTTLAVETKSVNLGQGFPDMLPPQHVIENLADIVNSREVSAHQYTRSFGHPRLVKALADLYSPLLERQIDPMNEVIVSAGAYGALFYSIMGFVNPGDEVIIIEPYFDCYEPMVRMAGGTPVFISLRPSKKSGSRFSSADWKLDADELASKFSPNTRAIVVNTPNNPLGKVFSRGELEMIADLCKKHDVICIADEVYEWLVYPGTEHIKIATLPGMWDHTITIGSAGKTFSITGWKLGWAVAPTTLMRPLRVAHQNSVYVCSTILQEAVARGLEHENKIRDTPECYFNSLPVELLPKRDGLAAVLESLGMNPTIPEAGYFMIADTSPLNVKIPDDGTDDPYDVKFVRWMCKEKKLAGIPPSAFYSKEHKTLNDKYIRFCFFKEDSTLQKAEEILREWKKSI